MWSLCWGQAVSLLVSTLGVYREGGGVVGGASYWSLLTSASRVLRCRCALAPGWQRQPGKETVQSNVEHALAKVQHSKGQYCAVYCPVTSVMSTVFTRGMYSIRSPCEDVVRGTYHTALRYSAFSAHALMQLST